MKLGVTLSLVLLVLAFTPCFGQTPGNPPPESKYPVVRLPPTPFFEMPKNLVRELKRRGCTVPQTFPPDERSNVIRGSFAKPGQTDWAVLCSMKGYTSFLVFWNGSAANSVELGKNSDDANRLFDWFDPLAAGSSWIITGLMVTRSHRRLTIKGLRALASRRQWCFTTTGASGSRLQGAD